LSCPGEIVMSGVLTQLVGRATGAVVPALRPRLPSLFEPGLRAAGFAEQTADIPADPAGLADRDDAPAPLPGPAAIRSPAVRPVPASVPKVVSPQAERPEADVRPATPPHQLADTSSPPSPPLRHPSLASEAVD